MPKRLSVHPPFLSLTIQKLKSDKKTALVLLLFVLLSIPLGYLTVPAIVLWWFFKKSGISKKVKIVSASTVICLIVVLVVMSIIAYAKDPTPTMQINEPAQNTLVESQDIVIKGTYEPKDRKVWINNNQISASDGKFETKYQLKEGQNKIGIVIGNWKRTTTILIVTRKLIDEEKTNERAEQEKPAIRPTTSSNLNPDQLSPTPSAYSGETLKVVKVIDGDTINVDINGRVETLRLIGIDTPETVDPRKPVQCFGVEASNKAREVLNGKSVRLEADATQGERDKYSRLLRYVFLLDGTNFNKMMVSEGYAHEYTYQSNPYKYQAEFKQAEKEAREGKRGLWADNACAGISAQSTTQNSNTAQPSKPVTSGSCKYSCSGADRDCSDFSTQAEAQAFFNCCGFTANYDPMKLDSVGVGDGAACESLP